MPLSYHPKKNIRADFFFNSDTSILFNYSNHTFSKVVIF